MNDRRLIELQERSAFQERALEQLNRVVAEQQLELDRLAEEVKELRGLLSRTDSGEPESKERALEDDRPPHY